MKGLPSYTNPELDPWSLYPGVPQPNIYYRFWRRVLQMSMYSILRIRVFNRHYEPKDGGVVYISNHQSYLDPILMSFALLRPMNYMARDSLFRNPTFARLINSVNAFPVKRGTADMVALKESMRRIKDNQQMVVFAEGTRTRDGRIGPFLPGVAMLSQRAAKWTVPVVIEGAFEAWPKGAIVPRPSNIVVRYAPPISQEEARQYEPVEFVRKVRAEMIEMQHDIRRRLGKPLLQYED